MKFVKKWLFPFLTCLIAAGAAVLPPYISRIQDAKQFGQVHAEALEADSLPAREDPTLLDRMELFVQYSMVQPILSFRDAAYFEDSEGRELANVTQELLTGAGVFPNWLFREEPFDQVTAGRVLLWDPAGKGTVQEVSVFWELHWSYYSNKNHQKSIELTLDAETGLPIHLFVDDTNMSQWLPYETRDLRALAKRFFDLLGVEVQEVEPSGPWYVPSLNLSYAVVGTSMRFHISRAPTSLVIQLSADRQFSLDTDGPTDAAG